MMSYHRGGKRGKDLALAIPRHTCYADTIKDADMVKCYFKKITKQDYIIAAAGSGGNTRQGFWLIKEEQAKLVYAIFQYSMFRDWCCITACREWIDEKGNIKNKKKGDCHFFSGMWNTFPSPKMDDPFSKTALEIPNWLQAKIKNPDASMTIRQVIELSGDVKRSGGVKENEFDEFMDELFGPLFLSQAEVNTGQVLDNSTRKKRLAESFLNGFYVIQ